MRDVFSVHGAIIAKKSLLVIEPHFSIDAEKGEDRGKVLTSSWREDGMTIASRAGRNDMTCADRRVWDGEGG